MDWSAIAKVYDPLKAGSIDGTDDMPHDHGIVRAMSAKYKPNKEVVGIPEHTIFIGRLSPSTDEESLGYVFSDYGEIKRLRLVRDIVTGFSRCYAFIEYFDEDCAYKAQREADKTILDEREIYVDFECERTLKGWIPRRLGGGVGGKKESGQLRFGGKNRPFRKPFNIDNVQKPEGDTFQDRLRAVERGEVSDYRGEKSDRNRFSEDRRQRRSNGSRKRSRSRDRGHRSRSKDRRHSSRSRDKDHRSRSKSRSSQRSRSKGRGDNLKGHYRSRSRDNP